MHTNTIPPSWWELTANLATRTRLVHLALLGLGDRDGVVRLSTTTLAERTGLDRRECHGAVIDLERAGLLATWKDSTPLSRWYAWVVHTTEWTPTRGSTSRPRDTSLPSPPREVVLETLRKAWGREPTPQEAKQVCPRAWGRVRATKPMGHQDQDVVRVWEAWRDRQDRPGACVLGDAARGLITKAMGEATPDQLILLFRYAWESDEAGPRFWRGHNDRQRKYLGLDNLLVRSKLAGRVQAALTWEETIRDQGVQEDGTDLGPMARYRTASRSTEETRVGPPGTTTTMDPRPVRLSRQCRTILDLLLRRKDQGVRTSELAEIALKYSARVSELRGAGVDVVCVERSQDGNNLYAMANWETWEDPESGEEVIRGLD